jgi:hypothetical protein
MIADAHLLPIWLGVVTCGLDYEGEGLVTLSTDENMKAVSGRVQYDLVTDIAVSKSSRTNPLKERPQRRACDFWWRPCSVLSTVLILRRVSQVAHTTIGQ